LRTILEAPDQGAIAETPALTFGHQTLSQWSLTDDPTEKEWQQVPVHCDRREDSVRLEGRFKDVRRIDDLSPDDPSFWVALSSRNWRGSEFPIDVLAYPVAEITFRCVTPNARPAWLWTYPGGEHFDGLLPSASWRTVARLIPHYRFPERIDTLAIRVYSATRTTEAIEIREIRFRALTAAEAAALDAYHERIAPLRTVPVSPVLEEFMPFGTYIAAGTAKQMARHLDISMHDYWRLALEDMVRQYHNCITVEEIESFTTEEWRELLTMAESFRIKVHGQLNWPMDEFASKADKLFDDYVRPVADCPALFGWSVHGEPPEHMFNSFLDARQRFEQEDPNRPLTVIMRTPNAFPLFAPFFAAAGVSHFKSHNAWEVSKLIDTHLPLLGGQQFWFIAPMYTYATDTPEWHTCPEARLMLNLALAAGARGWMAHTYHNVPIWVDGSFQRSLTGPFLTFSDLWAELGLRVERLKALAPLFLRAKPVRRDGADYGMRLHCSGTPRRNRPEGMPAADYSVLEGDDFRLYYITNNDIQDVAPLNIEIEQRPGEECYDLTDYVRTRQWEAMPLQRHVEMFPGQGRVILAAHRSVCEQARVLIAERIIEDDSRQISVDLGLVRRYDVDTRRVQSIMEEVGSGLPCDDLVKTREARTAMIDLLYRSPQIYAPRSKLIEVSAAICGCDGALCRLMSRGKADKARELGQSVLGFARELTHLRLELREGRGAELLDFCNDLTKRTLDLLEEVRAIH
jgi:hypothetical protein